MPACALLARKNFVLHHSRPDERADQVRNDGTTALWIPAYAGMTVRDARNDGVVLLSFGKGFIEGVNVHCSGYAIVKLSRLCELQFHD